MVTCPTCRLTVEDGALTCPVDGTSLSSASPMIGKVLGDRYRILSVVGQGGMGTVFLAEHVVLGKRFAVKILRDELSRDEELVHRFQQEAVAASRIGQENIVSVNDFGRSPEGALYFVMEHIAGQSLASLVHEQGALTPTRALPILAQICRALAAAHAQGIVHRDLKPDNVIVSAREDGTDFAKVLDFGVSKVAAQPNGARLTRIGIMMGTPEYMAPEQVEASSVDHRVDIYSFGVMAYELLTGSIPFTANTPVGILMKHQSEIPEPPSRRRPDLPIPPSLEATVLRAMAKGPEARQQSMGEVLSELSTCMTSLGIRGGYHPTPAPMIALPQPTATPRPEQPAASGAAHDEGGLGATFTPRPSQVPRAGTSPPQPARAGASDDPVLAPTFTPRPSQIPLMVAAAQASPRPRETRPPPPVPSPHESDFPSPAGSRPHTRAPALATPRPSDPTPVSPPARQLNRPSQATPRPEESSLPDALEPPVRQSGPARQDSPSPGQALAEAEADALAVRSGPPRWVFAAVAVGVLAVGGSVIAYTSMGQPALAPPVEIAQPKDPVAPDSFPSIPPDPTPPVAGRAEPPPKTPEPPASPVKRLSIRSNPAGAVVWRNNENLGATPLEIDQADRPVEYRFTRAGFLPLVRKVSPGQDVLEVSLKAQRKKGPSSEEDPYGKIEDFKDPF